MGTPKGFQANMKMSASHILVKHQGSRRCASWKDPQGVAILKRDKGDAHKILTGYIEAITSKAAGDQLAAFGEIAREHSDCGSATQSGDLGSFGTGDMQKAFEDGVLSVDVGQMTGIIDTD